MKCGIRMECLILALHNDAYGVWGGNTREERAELTRLRNGF